MDLSNGDRWIEGIGSQEGFLGIFLLRASDYSNSHISLKQMRSGNKTIYFNDRLLDTDANSGFLEEGKQWYVKSIDQPNTYYQFTLGAPNPSKGCGKYPVSRIKVNSQEEAQTMGYLYEVNKQIFWDNETIQELLLYNFNLVEGDDFNLWIDHNNVEVAQEPRTYGTSYNYTVVKADTVICNNIPRRRIFLTHDADTQTWIEGIGAISDPLYIDINRKRHTAENKTKNTLTCCYLNGELLYHNPQYPDCVETSVETISLSPDFYKIDNDQLIIYDHNDSEISLHNISGKLLYKKAIKSSSTAVSLQGLPEILIGKLSSKGDKILTFKIVHKN